MTKVFLGKIILLMIFILLMSLCFAKRYSDAPSGQGVSTVGIGGDYGSLYDASTDFNATIPTGSWTLYVLHDLTEEKPCFFGNTVGAGTTNTIKPAKNVKAVITFNQSASSLAGNLVIGSKVDSVDALTPTNNFIIDGSNNGTRSRNLTLKTSSKSTTSGSYTVRVFGDSDNVVIKNCNILDYAGSTNMGAAIGFCTRSTSRSFSAIPDNGRIENCYVMASAIIVSGTRAAISFDTYGFLPPGVAATNFSIVSNLVVFYNIPRGILLNGAVGGGLISANTVRGFLPRGVSVGLWPINVNGSNNLKVITVSHNVIDKMETGKTTSGDAIIAMNLCGKASGNGTEGDINCFNNIITGFKLTGSVSTSALKITGIRHYSIRESFNCFNNSINIPSFGEGWTGLTNGYAIGFEGGTYNGPAYVENNLIRINQKGFAGIMKFNRGATPAFIADYNDIVALSGSSAYRWGANYYATLGEVQKTFNKEIHSQSVDPMETRPHHWISENDLHFTGADARPLQPGTPYIIPLSIPMDIDGEYRNATAPWVGADEPVSVRAKLPVVSKPRLKKK